MVSMLLKSVRKLWANYFSELINPNQASFQPDNFGNFFAVYSLSWIWTRFWNIWNILVTLYIITIRYHHEILSKINSAQIFCFSKLLIFYSGYTTVSCFIESEAVEDFSTYQNFHEFEHRTPSSSEASNYDSPSTLLNVPPGLLLLHYFQPVKRLSSIFLSLIPISHWLIVNIK